MCMTNSIDLLLKMVDMQILPLFEWFSQLFSKQRRKWGIH